MKQLQNVKIILLSLAAISIHNLHSMNAQSQESSIHPIWYFRNSGKMQKPSMKTQYRTITDQLGATENAKIPQKAANTMRIATYNVHFWTNPFGSWGQGVSDEDLKKIMEVIKTVNADVLILQEVGGNEQAAWNKIKPEFEKMGYKSTACASISPNGVYKDGNLYNCIYSKYPFVKTIEKQYATNPMLNSANPEQRCFVGAHIQLPNNKQISVYGTHLEVRPIMAKSADGKGRGLTPDAARKEQMQELLEYIKNNDTNPNVIIGADFNTFRKQDLIAHTINSTTLWSILEKSWPTILKDTAKEVPQGLGNLVDKTPGAAVAALDYIASQGYKDSFMVSKFTSPQFTTWTGTMIDFLFLSPTWNLGVKGGYVFYSWASDHIPVIMDIDLSTAAKIPIKPIANKGLTGAAAGQAVLKKAKK